MYEAFEHTADVGLRIRAADLDSLFAEAGQGLFSLIVGNLADVRLVESAEIEIAGSDREYLFFDWLNELLYRFESGGMVFADFRVQVDETGLKATVRGEPVDFDRHQMANEVKAITYHQLRVEQTPDGWLAEVILDI